MIEALSGQFICLKLLIQNLTQVGLSLIMSFHSTTLMSIDLIFFFFFCFLGLHPCHMQVPRLEIESELQLPAYTIATAMWDPSLHHIGNLHHSSWQCQILNPLSEGRDGTCVLTDTVRFFSASRQQELLIYLLL